MTGARETSPALPRRRLGGLRARGAGLGFEGWLSAYIFRPLVERGVILRADKTDPPMRPIRDTARGVVFVPLGAGGGDFLLLLAGGRYGVVECKSTGEGRLYRDELTPEQIRHLDEAVKAGAAAFLACQFRTGSTPTAFLVPWAAAPWASARTAQSVNAADLARWKVASWIDAARILGISGA